ncbi:amino acid permease, partial [bacterium]|nr:amino acid permease [bacterium]
MNPNDNHATEDQKDLAKMGYEQELFRGFSAFSNYALSLSIICILAGGITSFHVGYCAAGPAAIGIGWPIACLFSFAVAAAMSQIASAFPTAGGLYHWGSLLGGRGWGWVTAWFNLAGIVTILAAINVGTWNFIESSLYGSADLGDMAQVIAVSIITFSQLAINLFGMRIVNPMTIFSGYWILIVTVALVVLMLVFGGPVHPERLFQFENFSGLPEGDKQVWPVSESIAWLFFLAMLLPAYTIIGFDGSAHAAEETVNAAIMQAVLISGIAGYILLAVAILVIDDPRHIAMQGDRAFVTIVEQSLPKLLQAPAFIAIVLSQYLCGMSVITAASRMAFAFARDGGLPFSNFFKQVSPKTQVPTNAIFLVSITAILFTLYSHLYDTIAAAATILLY